MKKTKRYLEFKKFDYDTKEQKILIKDEDVKNQIMEKIVNLSKEAQILSKEIEILLENEASISFLFNIEPITQEL